MIMLKRENLFYPRKKYNDLEELSLMSLKFFEKFARFNSLPLERVKLKAAKEVQLRKESIFESVHIDGWGKIEYVGSTYGTVVFIDISHSSNFFQKENNYTGFVIFNSFILLVRTITEAFNGEFLEHTGDGALVFFKDRNYIADTCPRYLYPSLEYRFKCLRDYNDPLAYYLLAAEFIKIQAYEKGLIDFLCYEEEKNLIVPSLAHVGASYGPVELIELGGMKKLVSKTVWDAANNCKGASRVWKLLPPKNVDDNIWYVIKKPIEVSEFRG